MIKDIKMPNLGTTTNEMKIVQWHKKVGDEVKRGEMLFEVETDKAVMSVESYVAGYLKQVNLNEGDTVTTGETVALVGEKEDEIDAVKTEKNCEDKSEDVKIDIKEKSIRISPMVKKIAERLGVDYATIEGTGSGGMITKEDIEKAANNPSENQSENVKNTVPFNRIEKATAKAMTLSKSTIPHVYFEATVDASKIIGKRNKSEKKVSYNAIIMKAVFDCLEDFPNMAAKYTDQGRAMPQRIGIGLAVANGNDLLVPVVHDIASLKGLEEIEEKIKEQINKTRENKLTQNDISGGVFTITNLGGFDIDAFTAIINHPEAAILAVASIKKTPIVENSEIVIRPMMKLTLSADHRVVNGAYAAEFLQSLKTDLEGNTENE